MLGFQGEIQRLKGGLSNLSVAKHVDVEKINQSELEIRQLKKNLSEAENIVVDQHKLVSPRLFNKPNTFTRFLSAKEILILART